MRYIILTRIDEIRKFENNFRKGTMRWDNFNTGYTKHISEMNFGELNDYALLDMFERIIRRYFTQM